MLAHPPGGARVSDWTPGAHGSGREAYQRGRGVASSSGGWRVVVLLSCRCRAVKIKYKYTTKKLYKNLYV